MRDDGVVHLHPPILRALDVAAQKLKAARIKVVEWEPVDHAHGWEIVQPLYFPDGGACQRAILAESGEPILPLTSWALDYGCVLTVPENWEYNVLRENYRARYHATMKERGVDFILCPTYIGVAPEQGTGLYCLYTAIWNLLDQPAVVFPSGLKVDQELDQVDLDYKPRSEADTREYRRYHPRKFVDAPIAKAQYSLLLYFVRYANMKSYQLIGKHHKDEETLAAAKLIEAIIKA